MDKISINRSFYKNGKKIIKNKIYKEENKNSVEKINSIFNEPEKFTIADLNQEKTAKKIKNHPLSFIEKIRKSLRFKVNHQKLRAGVTGIWAAASIVIIFSFLTSLMVTPKTAKPEEVERYSMYSSKPLKPQTATTSIYSKDSRAQRINEVYKMYNCPLEGLGDVMVYEADKNNIPWWLVAAVSFQESGCGKKSPKIDGAESYNAWGWAIYGDRTFSFDNWVRGIETVSKYFSENFYSKGITDTCEIMKTYTPPSNGSWCEGVNHFADLIKNYKTPQE